MTGWLEALGGLGVLSLLLIYVIGTFFARPVKADEPGAPFRDFEAEHRARVAKFNAEADAALDRFRGMSATKRLPFTMDDAREMMNAPDAEEVAALRARVEALEVDVKNLKAREYR